MDTSRLVYDFVGNIQDSLDELESCVDGINTEIAEIRDKLDLFVKKCERAKLLERLDE